MLRRSRAIVILLLALTGVARAEPPSKTTTVSTSRPASTSPHATRASSQRTAWLYDSGAIRKTGDRTWSEVGPEGKFSFREVLRADDQVTLHDSSRNLHLRLYDRGVYRWSADSKKWVPIQRGRWEDPRKKPLDEKCFPDERNLLARPHEKAAFPHLRGEYEVLRPATPVYNCIAWTLGMTDRWVWPSSTGKGPTLADFDDLYRSHGYRRSDTLNFEKEAGIEKVIVYGKRGKSGKIELTHGARQEKDGSWSSKLGQLPLIRHLQPRDIDGNSYGEPVALYVRTSKK